MDIFNPKATRHSHIDGAYFGTGFPHMLFFVHPEYRPKQPTQQFVPRLYGFKIHPLAYQLQYQAAGNFKFPVRALYPPGDARSATGQGSQGNAAQLASAAGGSTAQGGGVTPLSMQGGTGMGGAANDRPSR